MTVCLCTCVHSCVREMTRLLYLDDRCVVCVIMCMCIETDETMTDVCEYEKEREQQADSGVRM